MIDKDFGFGAAARLRLFVFEGGGFEVFDLGLRRMLVNWRTNRGVNIRGAGISMPAAECSNRANGLIERSDEGRPEGMERTLVNGGPVVVTRKPSRPWKMGC